MKSLIIITYKQTLRDINISLLINITLLPPVIIHLYSNIKRHLLRLQGGIMLELKIFMNVYKQGYVDVEGIATLS